MKITRLTTYHAAPRWLFLKVETDEGITGWGEPVIEGKARSVEAAVHELSQYVVGQDPARINDLWQTLYRGGFYRGGAILMSAIAGIDQALWDIKGKALGVPVYQLLGGLVRDRMKTYRWVGGDRPGDIVAQMQAHQALGYDTFKLNGTEEMRLIDSPRAVDAAVAKIAGIRAALGDTVDFGIDFHGRVGVPMARTLLRELEPYRPLFVEEPVLAEHYEHYARLADATSIPLAAGERMYSRFEFKHVLAQGGLAMLQPDLSHAGGITECLKIAAMAEAHDVALAPHCPLGPVALAACLQVDLVSHNAVLQEQSIGIHYNQGADLLDYLVNKEDFACVDGYIAALPRPGLGVEIDEERLIHANRTPPDWANPLWRHADGSVAEW
ncbi:galactonate dehydratase [Pseudoxanthomonas winnipegensis]|jgi:galactonate dehydratase|uniref:D-galactonate dehydratase n=1 Tax=Pseudoxanthomonas winnipegensis TaxID=2480810 RepID=A0A4Q8LFJ1_9GAMM|nr:galactonate dehydratase [Pseudoxanthomonas winnipegensis]TAA28177.1 galactonate dehydratase [Pseudoxanthomonas winnipegensis]